MILALDIATVAGWCHGAAGSPPVYGSVNLRHPAGTPGVILNLCDWLVPLCAEIEPTVIVFESPYVPHGRQGTMPINAFVVRRLYGMVGAVETIALRRKIRCLEATPTEISQFFLGASRPKKRDAKKLATIERCHQLGWPVTDDNQADALALWCMAEEKFHPGIRQTMPLFQTVDAPQRQTARRRGIMHTNRGDGTCITDRI